MDTAPEETVAPGLVIRVVEGHAGREDLAALTAVLLSRAGASTEYAAAHRHRPATWRRLERALSHRGARSWRNEARHTGPKTPVRA